MFCSTSYYYILTKNYKYVKKRIVMKKREREKEQEQNCLTFPVKQIIIRIMTR